MPQTFNDNFGNKITHIIELVSLKQLHDTEEIIKSKNPQKLEVKKYGCLRYSHLHVMKAEHSTFLFLHSLPYLLFALLHI
jgi:hypothetical protein